MNIKGNFFKIPKNDATPKKTLKTSYTQYRLY